jgi:lysophospholipase L1-like esterase
MKYSQFNTLFSGLFLQKIRALLFLFVIPVVLVFSAARGQEFCVLPDNLNIDTGYAYIQIPSEESSKRFHSLFQNTKNNKLVLLHYGASHVQSEIYPHEARKLLQDDFGHSGPGFLFPFSAANTYSSINYVSTHKGNWQYAKSFQHYPSVPLGARGMSIETTDSSAEFSIKFNIKIAPDNYTLYVFTDINELTPNFAISTGNFTIKITDSIIDRNKGLGYLAIPIQGNIDSINLRIIPSPENRNVFRFYGFNLQSSHNQGLIYHAMGVGAAPFESILRLPLLKEQVTVLNPDVVLLDFGTNNILYTNSVPVNMPEYVQNAINLFRDINPNIQIILTSTQDLFYKGKYIDAAVAFNFLMDSLAKKHHVLFWNYYDLSGGYAQIKNWQSAGYAQNDHIHLTAMGYKLKGYLLYRSIINTLEYMEENAMAFKPLLLPVKNYDLLIREKQSSQIQYGTNRHHGKRYVVKSGDCLSKIAVKHHTTVSKLKRANGLKSDFIRAGRTLKIP